MNRVYYSLPVWAVIPLAPVFLLAALLWLAVVLPIKVVVWFVRLVTPNRRDVYRVIDWHGEDRY